MKLHGSAEVDGTPEEVFPRLLDPELLARCIPGCQHVTEVEPGVYETAVAAGVGAAQGQFDGRVKISELDPPNSYRMAIDGESSIGHVNADARVRLEAAGAGTRIGYEGEARVSGLLASFGGRMIEGAANRVVVRFFERLVQEAGQ